MYIGAIVWIQTALVLVMKRLEEGTPWLRMVIILGIVAAFTAILGALMNSRTIKNRYGRGK